ncbi:hypothetical protein BH24ACT8_BH24ACT8_18580 [soil metagenome]
MWHGLAARRVASASALLVWRRSHPLAVAGASAVHMFVVGVLIAPVMATVPMQALYFFALYSGWRGRGTGGRWCMSSPACSP